ncbi:gluconokinase [Burkholderia sp. Bp9143]|nr:gluconokinase [Burkholderia sp. Bp9143]
MGSGDAVRKVVVMGVSGCGKSTLGAMLATALDGVFIEGDAHHLPESQRKMRDGIALDDGDREPWLDVLGGMMADGRTSVVVSCSALKAAYRARLRARVPDLRFVFLDIDRTEAWRRVAARLGHAFPPTLVANQFEALESPVGEDRVLRLSASDRREANLVSVIEWLAGSTHGIGRDEGRQDGPKAWR